MVLDISNAEERKRIKRNLLGLCGRETVKSIREIAFAMMPQNYSGYVSEMENEARQIVALGRINYRDNKFLHFTKITDNEPTERYRIKIEIADENDERNRGLSGRDSLGEKEGMLFVYDKKGTHSFALPLASAFVKRLHGYCRWHGNQYPAP